MLKRALFAFAATLAVLPLFADLTLKNVATQGDNHFTVTVAAGTKLKVTSGTFEAEIKGSEEDVEISPTPPSSSVMTMRLSKALSLTRNSRSSKSSRLPPTPT